MYKMYYLIHLAYTILIITESVICSGEQAAQRTDLRFIDSNFPSQYESTHYTKTEWNELVSNNVDLSNFDNLQQQVKTRLQSCGLRLDGTGIETEIELDNGRYRRIWLGSINGLQNAVLTMYTLGHPLHTGNLFYPQFNTDTRAAIEKRIASDKYDYFTEYALMDQAFIDRKFHAAITFYRGVNANFTFNRGDTYRFNQFTSASRELSIAKHFLQSGGTIFKIKNAWVIPMSDVSQYPSEEEYLIAPFQTFTVGDISEVTDVSLGQVTYVELTG